MPYQLVNKKMNINEEPFANLDIHAHYISIWFYLNRRTWLLNHFTLIT
jgi:hypothetical protein